MYCNIIKVNPKLSFKHFIVLLFIFITQTVIAQSPISPTTWGGLNTTLSAGPSNFSPLPASSTPGTASVSVSEWNRGIVTYNAGANRYNSKGWYVGTTSVSNVYLSGNYIYFTVTNNSSTELSITNITIGTGQASGTGPTTFGMMYQVGSGTPVVFCASASGPSPVLSGSAFLCAGETGTFYLCGWGATGAAGTWSINSNASITANYATAVSIGPSTSSSPVVAGGTLTLTGGTVTPGVAPDTYSWTGPLSYTSALQNPTITSIALGAAGTYTYSVTDAYSCSVSNTTPVIVTASGGCSGTPSGGTATPVVTSFCGSGSTTINLVGGTAATGLTYLWYSSTVSAAGPFTLIPGATLSSYTTPTITTTTYYNVQTTCTASSSTSTSATGTITINTIPTISVTPPGGNFCSGTSGLSITASGASTYSWIPATGLSATTGATVIANSTNATTYTVTGTSSAGCPATNTASVNYYITPGVPTVTPTSLSVCLDSATNLLTASTGVASPVTVSSGVVNITMSGAAFAAENPTINISSVPPGATITGASVTLNCSFSGNYQNAYVFNLAAPNGKIINLIKGDGCGACVGAYTNTVISSSGLSAVSTGATPFTGTYSADAFAVSSGAYTQNTALFSDLWGGVGANGLWTLDIYHNFASADPNGTLISWSITINYTLPPVSWSPLTNLFTDVAGTTAYTGTSTYTVYENPFSVGVITYTATANNNGCTNSTNITVTVNPSATSGTITGLDSFCLPGTITLSETGTAGLWSSSSTSVAIIDGTGLVTGVSSGTATISYTVTGCGTSVAIKPITLNAAPNAGVISGVDSICNGSSTTLSETVTGGTWTSSASAIATVSSTGVVSSAAVGTTIISYTFTNSCGTAVATFPITVNPLPNAGSISGATTVCIASVTSLTESATGGVWSSGNTTIATVDGSGNVTGVGTGVVTISYTVTNSCGSAEATVSVTVNPLPNAGVISGLDSICNGLTTTLSETVTGGTWSSSSTAFASVSSFGVVTAATVGTAIMSYTQTNSCGTAIATFPITINPMPNAGSLSGTTTVCVASMTTLTESATGGVWSSGNSTIATVDGTGDVTGVGAGVVTILYTVTNSCGSADATVSVTINPLPYSSIISGTDAICLGSNTTLTDSISGGTWSSGLSSIASIDATGIVTGVSVGSTIITYSYTNTCGTAYSTIPFTVNLLPSAGTITGSSTLCDLTTITLSDGTTGGTWNSSNTLVATVSISGIVSALTVGTDSIIYTVTSSCGTASTFTIITVNPLPVSGSITGVLSVCESAITSLTDLVTGGTWSSSLTSISTVDGSGNVTGILTGVADISYSVTNSCGTATTSVVVSVNPLPVSGIITGLDSVCNGATITLSDLSTGGGWSSSITTIASVTGAGVILGLSVGTTTISYNVTNSCGTSITTYPVTVNPLPVAGSITDTTTLCELATTTLTDLTIGGIWSSSNTGIATVDGLGNVSGVSAGVSQISYTVTNSCGSASTYVAVTVNPLPTAGTITGLNSVCYGTTITLAEIATGGTWTSSNTAIAQVSATGIVLGLIDTIATISYTVSNSCGTSVATYPITVLPLPNAATITGTTNVCVSSIISLSDTVVGGVWYCSTTGIATVDGLGNLTGVTAGIAEITYTVINSCGSAMTAFSVTVNPAPVTDLITGTAILCIGSSVSLTDTTFGGTWSTGLSTIATVDASGNVTGVANGVATISYLVTNSCGSIITTKVVTVNSLPDAGIISGTSTICGSAITTLTETVSGGIWSSANTGLATINTTGIVTGVSGGIDTILYSITDICGTSTTTFTITIDPLPFAGAISGTSNVCIGGSITLTDTVLGGIWNSVTTSIATIDASGVVSGISAGVAIISYTKTNTCGSITATKTITVSILPVPSVISGISTLCTGAATLFSDSMSGGTWHSSDTNVVTINDLGIATGVTIGSALITYSVTDICGTGFVTLPVTVITTPSIGAITGSNSVCQSDIATLSDITGGGTWSSSNPLIASILASGVVTGNSTGIATISYTVSFVCGSTIEFHTITVNPLPNAGFITGASTVCVGTTTALFDAVASGVWSSDNTALALVDGFGVVTGVSVGVVNISYTVTTGCGTVSTTFPMTVNLMPIVDTISGTTSFCLDATATLIDTPTGGLWSSTTPSVATISSTGVLTGVSAGNALISYSVANSCGITVVTKLITVNPIPSSISGSVYVCVGGLPTTLSDATTGGIWISSDIATATIDSITGIINGIASSSATISYLLGTGCYATSLIIVNPLPNAGTIIGANSVCQGSIIALSDITTGGIWSSSNSNATVSAGIVTGMAGGVDTIRYSITNTCGTGSASKTITINPLPDAGILIGANSVCIGNEIPLTPTVTGGVWSITNSHATVTGGLVTGVSFGTDTIKYFVTNSCGTTHAMKIINIITLPPSITGSSMICEGYSSSLSESVSGYWTSNATTIAPIDSLTGLVFGANLGTATITFTAGTGCITTTDVTINPHPSPISGANNLCIGGAILLSDTGTGTWVATNSNALIGLTTGIVTGMSPGIDTFNYSLTTGCIVSTIVTVNPLPDAITGTLEVCPGSTNTIMDASTGGLWSTLNVNVSIDSLTGVLTGLFAGIDTVSYMLPTGCAVTTLITVNPLPAYITGSLVVCQGATIPLSDSGSGTWNFSNANAYIGITTGIVTGNVEGLDTVTYTLPTGCWIGAVVTINPLPHAGVITGADSLCVGATITLSDTVAGGIWFASNTRAIITSGLVVGVASGLDTIGYQKINSCGISIAIKPIIINPLPNAGVISGDTNICVGQVVTLTDGSFGGIWNSQNTLVATVTSAGSSELVTGIAGGVDTIFYNISNSCGFASTFVIVDIDSTPVTNVTGKTYVCISKFDTLSNVMVGGIWTATNGNATVTDGIVTGVYPGIDTIICSITNFCGSSSYSFIISIPTVNQCDSMNYVDNISSPNYGALNVFPNPNTGKFTLLLTSNTEHQANVLITNIVGQKIADYIISTNQPFEIELNNGIGMYFITATTTDEIWSKKVLVTGK